MVLTNIASIFPPDTSTLNWTYTAVSDVNQQPLYIHGCFIAARGEPPKMSKTLLWLMIFLNLYYKIQYLLNFIDFIKQL